MKRELREERPSNTSDWREARMLEPRLMDERDYKLGDGGREGNERENEGCSIHQKHQIQVKQHCWIENSKMKERSEGRNEWWRGVRRKMKREFGYL